MQSLSSGSLRLGQFWGIPVFVHWSWFVVAYFEIENRINPYQTRLWNVLEYLAIFGIVLMHEFGHALACRQVGGRADKIVLWPLGGLAMVQPPPRPGATLWSIAAGPLVNVFLVPVTVGLVFLSMALHWPEQAPDLGRFVFAVFVINAGLLIFNLLPFYPLDGGQILQSLLWFVLGRGVSLMIVSILGGLGGLALLAFGVFAKEILLSVISVFVLLQCFGSFMQARLLLRPGLEPLLTAQDHIKRGEFDAALVAYTRALQELPGEDALRAAVLNDRGTAYSRKLDLDRAIADYDEAIRLQPDAVTFYSNRGVAYWRKGAYPRALADYEHALELNPEHPGSNNNLAWLLATCPLAEFRDGQRALHHARRACELSTWSKSNCLGTLGAAFAEVGDFAEALRWQRKAMDDPDYMDLGTEKLRLRLQGYEEGRPYRDEPLIPAGTGPG